MTLNDISQNHQQQKKERKDKNMQTVYVVTHHKTLHLIDGVFSSQKKAEDYIAEDMANRAATGSPVELNFYSVCRCTVDLGDSCYIRHSSL